MCVCVSGVGACKLLVRVAAGQVVTLICCASGNTQQSRVDMVCTACH